MNRIHQHQSIKTLKTKYAKVKADSNEAGKIWGDYANILASVTSAIFVLDNDKKYKVSARTDSEGQFKINLPRRGHFRVIATGERAINDSIEEHYFWTIRLVDNSFMGGGLYTIELNNDKDIFKEDTGYRACWIDTAKWCGVSFPSLE